MRTIFLLIFLLATANANADRPVESLKRGLGVYFEEPTSDSSLGGKVRFHGIVRHNGPARIAGALIKVDGKKMAISNDTGYWEVVVAPGKHILSASKPEMACETSDTILTTANQDYKGMFSLIGVMECVSKPVIYLYPEEQMDVSVQVNFKGQLDFTYPTYDNGWTVEANPDGRLIHKDKTYHYLFWDGYMDIELSAAQRNTGFIVAAHETVAFLEARLEEIGLAAQEKQDFITYWAPRMLKNEFNYVHFFVDETSNDLLGTLYFQPQPESLLRVFMVYEGVEAADVRSIEPQSFPDFERSGFTVVEWGGSALNVAPNEP